jgi:ABC-2 type transport system permease protein
LKKLKKQYALVKRELKMIFSYKGLLVTSILSPLSYFLLFAYTFSVNFSEIIYKGKSISYLNFLFLGIIAMQAFNQFGLSIIKTSNDKRFGMIRMLFTTDITTADYFVSKVIGSFIIVFLQLILLLIGYFLIDNSIKISILQFVFILAIMFLGTTFWNLTGSLLGLYCSGEDVRDILTGLLSLPILFASSVFYNVGNLPKVLKKISQYNPLSFIVDIMRDYIILNSIRTDLICILGGLILFLILFISFFADSFLKKLR